MAYSTSGVLPVDDLPAGISLLVSGPPRTRKRELMIRLLGGDPDDETIMVTTKMGAGKLLALFREWNGDRPPGRLHVVDRVTKERGLGRVRETSTTSGLSSPPRHDRPQHRTLRTRRRGRDCGG